MITVFTPTYNRAHLLPRLYESLCKQTFKDFEWVIVDDGSVDDTKEVVDKFLDNSFQFLDDGVKVSFPIFYFDQVFLILDSDDSLPPRSLETICHYYQQIKDDMSFGGVCGYMAHHDGTIIGHGCDAQVLDVNTIDLRYKYHVQGDMLEVFRTSVIRANPFPEIDGEKFVPEALVWNRIARKYRLRVFHEIVYFRDYIDGGLTDKIVKIRMKSPIASMMTYEELNRCDIPFVYKVKSAINYWRFRFCSDNKKKPKLPWWYHWTMPLGFLFHLLDERKLKVES